MFQMKAATARSCGLRSRIQSREKGTATFICSSSCYTRCQSRILRQIYGNMGSFHNEGYRSAGLWVNSKAIPWRLHL